MARTYTNARGQRVTQDSNGAWRVVNAAGEPKGVFAESPFKHGGAPQPTGAASAAPPSPPPTPPARPAAGAGGPSARRGWTRRDTFALVAILMVFFGLGGLGLWYFQGPDKKAETKKSQIASMQVLTVDDLDGRIDGRFKAAFEPFEKRLGKVEQTSKALEKGLADVNEKVEISKSEVLAKVDEVLKNLKTKTPEAAPPAPSAPTTPPVGDKLAQQNAQIRAACPPDYVAKLNLETVHRDEVLESTLRHCETLKEPIPPVAAAEPAQGSEEEEEQVADLPPAARQAGYRPGGYGPGYGSRRGRPNCRHWPGFAYNPANGRCELTRGRDASVAKYDRPRAGCRIGEVQTLSVPLPNGGTRTIRMVCRAGGR